MRNVATAPRRLAERLQSATGNLVASALRAHAGQPRASAALRGSLRAAKHDLRVRSGCVSSRWQALDAPLTAINVYRKFYLYSSGC